MSPRQSIGATLFLYAMFAAVILGMVYFVFVR